MNKKNWVIGLTTLACLCMATMGFSNGEPHFGMMYVVEGKAGKELKLYDAIREHVAWRQEHGDPWSWDLYQEIVGENLGTYHIASWGHTMSEIDDYQEFLAKGHVPWVENVMPYVARETSLILEFEPEISNWPEGTVPNYVLVIDYTIKTGQMWKFMDSVKAIHKTIMDNNHPILYSFQNTWAGSTGDIMSLAIPAATLAELEGPEENVFELMVRIHGEEKAVKVFEDMNSAVKTSKTFIVKQMHELAVKAAE